MDMQERENVIEGLQKIMDKIPSKILEYSKEEINHKPVPEKWSKKEILGHLCDSAFNNLQRLVRVQYEEKPWIVYNQDEWVKNQNYQRMEIKQVIDLWLTLHKQLIQVIRNFPEKHLESVLDVGEEVTAKFIITDYLDHQNHHIKQILLN
jgi:hypothetical protein